MKETDVKLLEYTVEIVKATVSNAADKSSWLVNNDDAVIKYMQSVYDKLKEINESFKV